MIYLIVNCGRYFPAGVSNSGEMNDYISILQKGHPIDRSIKVFPLPFAGPPAITPGLAAE